jgi:hypothetical protein
MSSLFSGGGESVDSAESYEEEIDQRRLALETNQENNIKRLVLMARYLIRAVGDHVKILLLGCCPGLTNGLVRVLNAQLRQSGEIVHVFASFSLTIRNSDNNRQHPTTTDNKLTVTHNSYTYM